MSMEIMKKVSGIPSVGPKNGRASKFAALFEEARKLKNGDYIPVRFESINDARSAINGMRTNRIFGRGGKTPLTFIQRKETVYVGRGK